MKIPIFNQRLIELAFGFSFFLPSVSILNIGHGTAIQIPVLLSLFLLMVTLFSKYRDCKISEYRISFYWFASILIFIVIQLVFFILKGHDLNMYIKGLCFFSLSLFMLFSGIVVNKEQPVKENIFTGYIYGGVFSSVWAIIQVFVWKILKQNIHFLVGIQNSNSFSKYSDGPYFEIGRGFAFTPEPSILFLLLVVSFFLTLNKNIKFKKTLLVLQFLGMISSASMGIIVVIPIVTIYYIFIKGYLKKKYFYSLLSVPFILTVISAILTPKSAHHVTYSSNLFLRIENITRTASYISRTNSLRSGFIMMIHRPLFGWGIQSDQLIAFLKSHSTIYEQNIGIDSFLLSIGAWFGIIFVLLLFYPVIKFIFTDLKSSQINSKLFVFASVIPAFFSLSYYNVYHVWFAVGLGVIALNKDKFIEKVKYVFHF